MLSKLLIRCSFNYAPTPHEERNHQGKANRLLFPTEQSAHLNNSIRCRESLGGLLTFYHRQAA